jgi:CheY-like chemotaxis protein
MPIHDPEAVKQALPGARRFARALCGNQVEGDRLVAAALTAGLPPLPAQIALYAAIAGAPRGAEAPQLLSPLERRLLLLLDLERLSPAEAAQALGIAEAGAEAMAAGAHEKLRQASATDVLIIEDEPLIAMDIRQLVERSGHRVVGVAASEQAAIELAQRQRPGLILADVNLGRGGDGIEAVRRILASATAPVIFVTAYPERLLLADGVPAAFVIRKPFDGMTLAVATYQAVSAGRLPIG